MVRFKNRWLLVEFMPCSENNPTAGQELNAKLIWLALKESVVTNFGDVGWGAVSTSLTVKYFSPMTNLCIIRVARDHHRLVWGAVTLLTRINGKYHIPHVVHIAGTIKHAQLAAIKYNREVIARYRSLAIEKYETVDEETYAQYLVSSQKEIEGLQD